MKLKRVQFDRYVGYEQERRFNSADYDIEYDAASHIVAITPRRTGLKLTEKVLVSDHNADMYPEEVQVEPAAARPLPAKPVRRS